MPQCPDHPGKPLRDSGQYGLTCTYKVGVANLPVGTQGARAGTNKNGYCKYAYQPGQAPEQAPGHPIGNARPANGAAAAPVVGDTKMALAVAALDFAAGIYQGNASGANEALALALSAYETMLWKTGSAPKPASYAGLPENPDDDIPF